MSFSKRLKELREGKGLSQEELAEKLDIPRTSVTHYERGDDRIPRPKRLQDIADFFGVTVDYLIGRGDGKKLNKNHSQLLEDIDGENPLSIEDLMKKHKLMIDGRPATKEEIEGAIAFIRSYRKMK